MTEEQKALAVRPHDINIMNSIMDGARFQQMLAAAEFFSKSDLIPVHFRGKPANVFLAMELALRTDMSVFAIMENLYVVHGRRGMEAKLVIAMINASGKYDQDLEYELVEKDGKIVSCVAWTMKNGRKIVGPEVTAKMVQAEGWDKNPKWSSMAPLMFRYRASAFFGRTQCPEVTMGLQTKEELEDIIEMAQVPGNGKGEFFAAMPEEEVEEGQDVFTALVQSREADPGKVDTFVAHCAEVYKMSPEEIKAKASVNPDNFFGAFEKWAEKQGEKKQRKPRSDKGTHKAESPQEPAGETKEPESGENAVPAQNNPVDADTVAEMQDYCQKLGLSEENTSVLFTEDRNRRTFDKMTVGEAGKCLSLLMDKWTQKQDAEQES